MCEHCDCNKTREFAKGAVLGAALGAVLGILFAPDSGEGTRKRIKSESLKLKSKGMEALEDLKDKIDEAEDKMDELKRKAEPMIQDAIDDAEGRGEEIRDSIVQTAERLEEKAKNLKNRYFKGTK